MARLVSLALILVMAFLVIDVSGQMRVSRRREGFGRRFGFACCSGGGPADRLSRPGSMGNNRAKRAAQAAQMMCCMSRRQANSRRVNASAPESSAVADNARGTAGGQTRRRAFGATRATPAGRPGGRRVQTSSSGTGVGRRSDSSSLGSTGAAGQADFSSSASGSGSGNDRRSSPIAGSARPRTVGRRRRPQMRRFFPRRRFYNRKHRVFEASSSGSGLGNYASSSRGSLGRTYNSRLRGRDFGRNRVNYRGRGHVGANPSGTGLGSDVSSSGSAGKPRENDHQIGPHSRENYSTRQAPRGRAQIVSTSSGSSPGSDADGSFEVTGDSLVKAASRQQALDYGEPSPSKVGNVGEQLPTADTSSSGSGHGDDGSSGERQGAMDYAQQSQRPERTRTSLQRLPNGRGQGPAYLGRSQPQQTKVIQFQGEEDYPASEETEVVDNLQQRAPAPKPKPQVPANTYGHPRQLPAQEAPEYVYEPPRQLHKAPAIAYGPPPQPQEAPTRAYGPPGQLKQAPARPYAAFPPQQRETVQSGPKTFSYVHFSRKFLPKASRQW